MNHRQAFSVKVHIGAKERLQASVNIIPGDDALFRINKIEINAFRMNVNKAGRI